MNTNKKIFSVPRSYFNLGISMGIMLIIAIITISGASAQVKPAVDRISPNPANLTAGSFDNLSSSFSDGDGWQDINNAYLLISDATNRKYNSVFIKYSQNKNILSLRSDDATRWISCQPGSTASISNGQVVIDCTGSTINGVGNLLTVNLKLKFLPEMAGRSLDAYQRAVDDSRSATKWSRTGTVNIIAPGSPPPPPPAPDPGAKRYDWASYYGSGNLDKLSQFKLVDIDVEDGAGNYSAADVAALKSGGTTVVSYLNIGAAENFRSYWSRASGFKLGLYQGWPGEYWMDVSNPEFRDMILNTVAPQLIAKGVDGFYLDNIDVVDEYPNRPDIRQGVVELVRQLREKYPDKIIIGQTYGLTPLGDTGSDGRKMYQYLNGISKEEVNSTYEGGYQKVSVRDSDQMIAELAGWKSKGLEVLTLDYATSDALASYDYSRSLAAGFRPYVANKELNRVYLWAFAPQPEMEGGQSPQGDAPQPELITAGSTSLWASYADYLERRLTVDLAIINTGNAASLNTRLTDCSSKSDIADIVISGSTVDLQPGGRTTMKVTMKVPQGVERFRLMFSVYYEDENGFVYEIE